MNKSNQTKASQRAANEQQELLSSLRLQDIPISSSDSIKPLIIQMILATRSVELTLDGLERKLGDGFSEEEWKQRLLDTAKEFNYYCSINLPAFMWRAAALELTESEAEKVHSIRKMVGELVAKFQQDPISSQQGLEGACRYVLAVEAKLMEFEGMLPRERKHAEELVRRGQAKDRDEKNRQRKEKWLLVAFAAVSPPFAVWVVSFVQELLG